ncbi:TIGR02680 family protein [Pseudonocardia asaccharolytica]|uniref:TIGR02680 family protein n=1 Tax=Pseudonocardia asaccharolytica DSM 44247 = NBRC 16224 TaxID=1123024 RepID=A0A511D0V6_9PSEU|nr:TIGR02680 family protein [Pseudonocardia asaccharolytica]GEL18439.1 hypothetical protein PA7_22760 [Pseudonocardia asaccharolytica DSM 44247 = NBRC 16224]
MTTLPEPALERWQPLRAGLVDLFYYDVEEFRFHDGRLLLRGNNGAGKSKVLALLLPFLLDGDLSAHRVEPDADPKKRMEWNLLLGGDHPHSERFGYTWLEFGRRREDGDTEFCTIGCGLKAVAGRGIAKHWFFVTDQRVGTELSLLDATRTALSRERLADALAGRGAVHDQQRDYRRAVDEALFRLGEQRYGALVDLLVQLRQPQLSKRPNEKALSAALTEALPPLDQAVIRDVADAFRTLEADRNDLAAMVEAHGSAQAFLGHYRRYAAVAARRRAELPRRGEQRYRQAREAVTTAETAYADADYAVAETLERRDELAAQLEELQAQDRELRTSPAMDAAADLERLRTAAREARESATDAANRRNEDAAAVADRERRLTAASTHLHTQQDQVTAFRSQAAEAAAAALLAEEHLREIDAVLTDTPHNPPRTAAAALVDRRKRALRHVVELLDIADQAAAAAGKARAERDRLDSVLARLADQRAETEAAITAAAEVFLTELRSRLAAAVELVVADVAAVLEATTLWAETLAGPNPARVAIDAAGRAAADRHARVATELDRRAADAEARTAELQGEIARLEAGEDGEPPAPHTRDPGVRDGRPGAPFWRLIDFSDDFADDRRAGLEAALEASGVLDAWVDPDGVLRDQVGDVVLAPAAGAATTSLATVLRPAADPGDDAAAAVPVAVVERVLGAIGFGAGDEVWVDDRGRFRLGPLTGSWHKLSAEYIGRGARDAARRARLVVLREEVARVEDEQRVITDQRTELAGRRSTLDSELAAQPDDAELQRAHATLGALAAQHRETMQDRVEAERRLGAVTEAAAQAAAEVTEGAQDVDLPPDRTALDDVQAGVHRYELALTALWPAAEALGHATDQEQRSAADLQTASETHLLAVDRAEEAERRARASAAAHAAREETVGASVRELQERLASIDRQTRTVTDQHRASSDAHTQAFGRRSRAEGERETAGQELEKAAAERAAATEQLRRFAATGLLAVALPELALPDPANDWAPDPTVRLARQIDQELDGTPHYDTAWDRAQRRVNDELKGLTDALAVQGHRVSAELLADGIVVEVLWRGRPATVPELAEALGSEITDRRRLLDEREREILENHLVNEVASTLQELISEAEGQVRRMNDELAARPTSTGMRLRLDWLPVDDGPPGLAEARRRLLRQTSDAWSEEDRTAVGGFLQERIAAERAADDKGTWLEHLTLALDYRSWHRFAIKRHQNGQWRPATGPASGGERVLAASVPLFAAASAHYASAGSPHAPRLVMLDEAFAGVDDNARAKYLGLLAAFDLDVVMTSEREWGCYPEVPGLSIAQLARADGVPAVLVTHWRWDGSRRERMPRPVVVPEQQVTPVPDEEALF